jgi:hypothetical protein
MLSELDRTSDANMWATLQYKLDGHVAAINSLDREAQAGDRERVGV